MQNKKSTKRALITSALSLVLCMSMLIGTTFAWFTDNVTSTGNKIQSGTLKVDLELLDKETKEWNSLKTSPKAIFDYDKWEPGYTDVKILKVQNEGTLALKWMAKFVSTEKLTKLADVIDVYVCPSATELAYPDGRTLSGYTRVGTVADFVNTIETTTTGSLAANETAYLGIALKMQETAGNEYQNMSLGGAFDIQIVATQLTSEFDSFDNQYDKDATYYEAWDGTVDTDLAMVDGVYQITSAAELAGFAQLVNTGDATMTAIGTSVELTTSVNLADVEWEPIGSCNGTYFKGTFNGNGNTIYNLAVNNEDTDANATSGLFGWSDSPSPITVSNLTIDGATINGHHAVGVVVGYLSGTVSNCKVVDATVNGTHANDDADGDKVGGVVGILNVGALLDNKVSDSTISGNRDIGGIAGSIVIGQTATGNVVKNTTVTYATEKTYASAGAIVSGRTGFVPDSTNKAENVTVMKAANSAATLKTAIADAQEGETVTLGSDIEIASNASFTIEKDIVIDLNGNTLTTGASYGGIQAKGGCSIKNGTINYTKANAAIKVWDVKSIENVTIIATPQSGSTIGGIVIQSNSVGVDLIKNVTMVGVTNGIETYNCGNATEPVIGRMENVTIDATKYGMIVSAPIGDIVNCNIKGAELGMFMQLKGTYNVSANLINCTVTGETGIYAFDEAYSNPGTFVLNYDEATVINGGIVTEFSGEDNERITINGVNPQ